MTWRIARRLAWTAEGREWDMYPDEEVAAAATAALLPALTALTAPAAAGAPATGRRIKASLILDQTDESEFPEAEASDIQAWHAAYLAEKKAPCPPEREPTEDQLAGLRHRVVTTKKTPYADFAISGPFGRKTYKLNKFRTWVPTGDGAYISREVPGPENHAVWLISWRVFAAACTMLGIIGTAALEAYEGCIEKLVALWGDAWHLIYQADDLFRAEHCERVRRAIAADVTAGNPSPPTWSAAAPWAATFLRAATDRNFWNEHVVQPATSWRSRGSKGKPQTVEETLTGHDSRPAAAGSHSVEPGAKRHKLTKGNRIAKLRDQVNHLSQGQPSGKGDKGGKGNKGGK
ncbi:MAG: hypothetical protein OSB41_14110, partial [Kiritimatiellae bacterium]|nr:hypothetical protein [Kiritimatiellia bacterium]